MGQTSSERITARVGREIKKNPPKVLASTRKKFGPASAESQRRAILLSKARKAGARIPRRSSARSSR